MALLRHNPFCGKYLDVRETQADQWIEDHANSRPEEARKLRKYLTKQPTCQWIGDWTANPRHEASSIAKHARANNALYQIVLYNIPNRDKGGFSAGGAGSKQEYLDWVRTVASGLGSQEGIIIVEPDALAHAAELDENHRNQRLALLRDVVAILRKKCKHAYIYIDAGHPDWLKPEVALGLLFSAGIRQANGISLNVSNSQWTEECYEYGKKIVEAVSEMHGIVVDTSRNGAGPPPPNVTGVDAWANPASSRVGMAPTLSAPRPNNFSDRLHALLWIKVPGESDGKYNGAPHAGMFWPTGAMSLLADKE